MGEPTETSRLLEALRDRVRSSGVSLRELERQLGLGHGTLGHILRGRTELRLRHLTMLGRALGFTLEELLTETFVQRVEEPAAASIERIVTRVVRAELAAFREAHGCPK